MLMSGLIKHVFFGTTYAMEKVHECAGWIQLTQDMVQWRVLVNTVMNFRFTLTTGKFLNSCETLLCNVRRGMSYSKCANEIK